MKSKTEIQSEALQITSGFNRFGIDMSMGSGKTLFGLKDMERQGVNNKFLVVAPKVSIFQSWRDDAVKFSLNYLIHYTDFTTYLSLPKQSLNYHTIYLDEMQNLKSSHTKWLDSFKGRIVGLSGTVPVRGEKLELVNKYCPIVYTYSVDDAVDDKIINNYKIQIHLLDLSTKRDLVIKKGFVTSELNSYLYWTNLVENSIGQEKMRLSIQRMKALMNFKTKEIFAKNLSKVITSKHIIFANTTEQADLLCFDSYHSKNSNSENNLINFKQGTINSLSCVLQLNEGINIPGLKESIILHSYGNPYKLVQRLGRGFRLNPDDTHTCHILCYRNTIDEYWVKSAMLKLNKKNVEWI